MREIFGGVLRTEFHKQGTKVVSTTYEPFYLLNLEIPKNCFTLQECLDSYFQERVLNDYAVGAYKVKAWHRQFIDKLPYCLCLHLKRFIYTDRLIKNKDFIQFDEVLEIKESLLSPCLRQGGYTSYQYRLFSVIEHQGQYATSGHYVSYTMDADDQWQCFDDLRVNAKALDSVLDAQAYILFFELV